MTTGHVPITMEFAALRMREKELNVPFKKLCEGARNGRVLPHVRAPHLTPSARHLFAEVPLGAERTELFAFPT